MGITFIHSGTIVVQTRRVPNIGTGEQAIRISRMNWICVHDHRSLGLNFNFLVLKFLYHKAKTVFPKLLLKSGGSLTMNRLQSPRSNNKVHDIISH